MATSTSQEEPRRTCTSIFGQGKVEAVSISSLRCLPDLVTRTLQKQQQEERDCSPMAITSQEEFSGKTSSVPQRVAFLWDADDTLVTAKGHHFRGQPLEDDEALREVLAQSWTSHTPPTSTASAASSASTCRTDAHHFILSLGSVEDLFSNPRGNAVLAPHAESFGWRQSFSTTLTSSSSPLPQSLVVVPGGVTLVLDNDLTSDAAADGVDHAANPSPDPSPDPDVTPLRGFSLTKENLRTRPPESSTMIVDCSKLQLLEAFALSGHYDLVVFTDNSLEQCGMMHPSYPPLQASELKEMLLGVNNDDHGSSSSSLPEIRGGRNILNEAVGTELLEVTQRLNATPSAVPVIVANLWVTNHPTHKVLPGNYAAPLELRPLLLDFLTTALSRAVETIFAGEPLSKIKNGSTMAKYPDELHRILLDENSAFQLRVMSPLELGLDGKDSEERNKIKVACGLVQEQLIDAKYVSVRWNFCAFVRLRRLLYQFEKEAVLGIPFPTTWKVDLRRLVGIVCNSTFF